MKSDKIKLIVAMTILVVAAVVFAWNMGLFNGGGGTPTSVTPGATGEAGRRGGAQQAPTGK